ncbi:hypothetical protein [Chamaesiphon sp. VAR_48_metabat_403]|uniref:hypothetical protein n=1 Tax=Chamaesiphon sp. VAR_48_metabat_403 TaxID=2964700 RepID=UPI00286E5C3A|nr:hypothetical protein [Chamaesiphon sp. VAR_48_metabat_403]
MMKSFIFAVTSIAYILSITNIADAKVKKSSILPQNRADFSMNTKQDSTITSAISNSDIKNIHQSIVKYYHKLNSAYPLKKIPDEATNSEVRFYEVTNNLKLTDWRRITQTAETGSAEVIAKVEAMVLLREYRMSIERDTQDKTIKTSLVGVKIVRYKTKINVSKSDGKWSISGDEMIDGSAQVMPMPKN